MKITSKRAKVLGAFLSGGTIAGVARWLGWPYEHVNAAVVLLKKMRLVKASGAVVATGKTTIFGERRRKNGVHNVYKLTNRGRAELSATRELVEEGKTK